MTETVESTSDDRTGNNAAHHQYRVLTENEKADMLAIKDAGADFIRKLETVASHYVTPAAAPGRELALARTKIEEAVMWAVKGITA